MGFCLPPRQAEAFFSSQTSPSLATSLMVTPGGSQRRGRLLKSIQIQVRRSLAQAQCVRSKWNTHGARTPGYERSLRPTLSSDMASAPSAPTTTTLTSQAVWHLNPANRIISPRGQFSRMENSISVSLLHQIAVELCWHLRCLLTPYLLPLTLPLSIQTH